MTTMRRFLRQVVLGSGLLMASIPSNVFSQNPPSNGAAPSTGVVTTTSGSSRVLEYGMVIVMFGAALFVVCRSSRRNV